MARRPMPNLKRIASVGILDISKHSSLQRFLGDAKPKFFLISNEVFAVATQQSKRGDHRKVILLGFNKEKGRFSRILKGGIHAKQGCVEITLAALLPTKSHRDEKGMLVLSKKRTGMKLFRLVLKEAVSFAREKGFKMIVIYPENKELEEYYANFGFKESVPGAMFLNLK